MTDPTFEGKTKDWWLSLRDKTGIGSQPEQKVHQALEWFESQNKKSQHRREDRKFWIGIAVAILLALLALVLPAYKFWTDSHPKSTTPGSKTVSQSPITAPASNHDAAPLVPSSTNTKTNL